MGGALFSAPNFVDIYTDDPNEKRENWLPTASAIEIYLQSLKSKGRKITLIRFTGHATSSLMQFGTNQEHLIIVSKIARKVNGKFKRYAPSDQMRVILMEGEWIHKDCREKDVTDLLKELLGPGARIELRGCNTAYGYQKSLTAQLSKALPGTIVAGNYYKTMGLNVLFGGINASPTPKLEYMSGWPAGMFVPGTRVSMGGWNEPAGIGGM